jgi:hypothetical protein
MTAAGQWGARPLRGLATAAHPLDAVEPAPRTSAPRHRKQERCRRLTSSLASRAIPVASSCSFCTNLMFSGTGPTPPACPKNSGTMSGTWTKHDVLAIAGQNVAAGDFRRAGGRAEFRIPPMPMSTRHRERRRIPRSRRTRSAGSVVARIETTEATDNRPPTDARSLIADRSRHYGRGDQRR